MKRNRIVGAMVLGGMMVVAAPAMADTCAQLAGQGLTHDALQAALQGVVPGDGGAAPNGGLDFPMWLTLVDDSGKVCQVVNSLTGSQSAVRDIWLGSRVISAQKANTANSFSTGLLALSTANLHKAVQPGGSLYGLQHSNPVDPTVAYEGDAGKFGTTKDPLVKDRVGGINVFGGGLTLYNSSNVKIGAIGVSGDTSCTDHVVAWKVRNTVAGGAFGVANVPGGVSSAGNDALIQGESAGAFPGGFNHPECLNNPTNANDGGAIEGN
ncbi:MAG: heme-binding protein [Candidatus Methylomirabilis oxyfera]|nr:heme-binding protein [Candidatus Methylomirabilis oxyfera]